MLVPWGTVKSLVPSPFRMRSNLYVVTYWTTEFAGVIDKVANGWDRTRMN